MTATSPWAGITPVLLDDMYRFRPIDFPDMQWPDDEDGPATFDANVKVAAAPFGGFIAVHNSLGEDRGLITFYTSAGRRAASADVLLEDADWILYMCWNERRDHLIVVTGCGDVHFIAPNGTIAYNCDIKLNQPANETLCASTRNGVVVYGEEGTLQLLQMRGQDYVLSTIGVGNYFTGDFPGCIMVIPDDVSQSRSVEVALSTTEDRSKVYRVIFRTGTGVEPRIELASIAVSFNIKLMALSTTGERVAIASERGEIGCSNAALADYKQMTQTITDEAPGFLSWLGEHTVAFTSPEIDPNSGEAHVTELYFFSPFKGYQGGEPDVDQVDIPDGAFFLTEPDGIRTISGTQSSPANSHRFFQVVEDYAVRVYYKFATKMVSALLRKAYDQYVMGDAESVATMRQITGGSVNDDTAQQNLAAAIQDALATAGWEFDVEQQKRLLRIAAYGKGFCPSFDSHDFVVRCKKIRALRAIRDPKVGMMLTMRQFECLPPDRLAKRLTDRHDYRLAFEIAKALGGRCELVMTAWASAKMRSMLTEAGVLNDQRSEEPAAAKQLDERINSVLVANMRKASGLSFIQIAKEARDHRREHLSIRLLEQEPSATNRVQALMHYGLMDQALAQAVDSSDAGLVFECLINLSRMPQALFPKIDAIDAQRKDSTASDLALVYLLHFGSATEMRKELFRTRPNINLHLQLMQYFDAVSKYKSLDGAKKQEQYDANMQQVASTVESALDTCADAVAAAVRRNDKDAAAEFTAVKGYLSTQQLLLEQQKKLVEQFSDLRFLNKSVLETMQLCWDISVGQPQMEPFANEFIKIFKLTEKQVQWAKIKAYEARRAADSIVALGGLGRGVKGAKPLLPTTTFIDTLIRIGCPEKATQFVAKLPNLGERLEYYVQCQAWGEATHECLKEKRPELLETLKKKAAHNPKAVEIIRVASAGAA